MSGSSLRQLALEVIAGALTVAVAAVGLEVAFRGHRNEVDAVLAPLASEGDAVTVLIVGNSHAAALGSFGLRPGDRAYNASIGSQDIFREYGLVRAFLPRLPRLRDVVVGLDYDAMGYNLSVFNQDWQDRQYYPYTGALYHDGTVSRLLARSGFFRANRDLLFLAPAPAPTASAQGPVLPLASGRLPAEEGCRRRAREHSVIKFRRSLIGENSAWLRDIAALARERGVAVYFVNTPKAACYRAAYAETTRHEGRATILAALGAGSGTFHDYFDDDRFGPEDFTDPDHLTFEAGGRLMGILAREAGGNAESASVPRFSAP